MKLQFDDHDLERLIATVVARVLAEREADAATLGDRLGYTESEAAALLGIKPHVLRDCRLRGKIKGSRVGRRILYSRDELLKMLTEHQKDT